jgi:hypothetical protein
VLDVSVRWRPSIAGRIVSQVDQGKPQSASHLAREHPETSW